MRKTKTSTNVSESLIQLNATKQASRKRFTSWPKNATLIKRLATKKRPPRSLSRSTMLMRFLAMRRKNKSTMHSDRKPLIKARLPLVTRTKNRKKQMTTTMGTSRRRTTFIAFIVHSNSANSSRLAQRASKDVNTILTSSAREIVRSNDRTNTEVLSDSSNHNTNGTIPRVKTIKDSSKRIMRNNSSINASMSRRGCGKRNINANKKKPIASGRGKKKLQTTISKTSGARGTR